MISLGIVRRIDDLGRIVIPKEIRKRLEIEEGEPMEIYLDTANNIVLKKYQPSIEEVKVALEEESLDQVLDEYAPNISLVKRAVIEYIDGWDSTPKTKENEEE